MMRACNLVPRKQKTDALNAHSVCVCKQQQENNKLLCWYFHPSLSLTDLFPELGLCEFGLIWFSEVRWVQGSLVPKAGPMLPLATLVAGVSQLCN